MRLRPGPGLRHLDMAGYRVNENNVVAAAGEVRGVGTWTATHIHDMALPDQEPRKDVPGPQPDQVTQARPLQTIVLVNQLIPGRHSAVDLHPTQYGKPAHAWRSVLAARRDHVNSLMIAHLSGV